MFFTCHPIPKFDTNTNLGYGLSSPVPASKPKKTNAENLDELEKWEIKFSIFLVNIVLIYIDCYNKLCFQT